MEKVTASIELIHSLLRFAEKSGLSREQLCEEIGLSKDMLEETNVRIPLSKLNALWEALAAASHDPNLGLHIGLSTAKASTGHVLSTVLMNSPDVASALKKFCRYHRLMTDYLKIDLEEQQKEAALSLAVYDNTVNICHHQTEAILLLLLSALMLVSSKKAKLLQAQFTHNAPSDTSEHHRLFGCKLVFASDCNQIVFAPSVLKLPVYSANPALLEAVESYAQEQLDKLNRTDCWADKNLEAIEILLKQGNQPTLQEAAYLLSIGQRNLQNKLQQEGVTFRQQLELIRKKLAFSYLEQEQLSFCDIAFLLGFSEQSAFNHSFKRWTGLTPKLYRQSKFEE